MKRIVTQISASRPLVLFHEMSMSIRPVRQAAQVAAIRINEFMTANSDTDNKSDNNGLVRARRHGYDSTIYVTRYLLDQCNNALSTDEKISVAQKLFENLNNNPTILVYEPKFRNAIVSKIKEFEEYLKDGGNKYNKIKYQDTIKILKLSMRLNICDSSKREMIYKHFDEVNSLLSSYESWMKNTPLNDQMNKLNSTLDAIKRHPCYVDDSINMNNCN